MALAPVLAPVPAIVAGSGQALAQQRIGAASHVKNRVVRIRAGSSFRLDTGGAVFRKETVRTRQDSSARLTFLDSTNLSIGPNSSVLLDRFVFQGRGPSQALTVNLVRGAFRFSTGALDKRAYKINTPVATIGVRGTVLGIFSQGPRTLVTMVDNSEALACTRLTARPRCVLLRGAGDTVVITRTGARRTSNPREQFSFQPFCDSDPGLCGGGSAPPPTGDALCGQ